MQSLFRELKTLAEEERKQEFSFGFDLEEETKKKKRKKKRKGKKPAENAISAAAGALDEAGNEDSEEELDELMRQIETVRIDFEVERTRLAAPTTTSVPDVTQSSTNASTRKDPDPVGENPRNKKSKKKNKNKKQSGNSKHDDEDDFLAQAIAKADADRAELERQEQAARIAAAKMAGPPPGLKGPRFVLPSDPTLDENLKNKVKYGQGKNLVAVGPAKVRDNGWLHDLAGEVEASTTSEVASSSSAGITYHSSPFTFGFDGL